MADSKRFSLNVADGKKILKGMGLALGGCACAYLATEVVPYVDESGVAGALVTAVASILLNVARKWLASHS